MTSIQTKTINRGKVSQNSNLRLPLGMIEHKLISFLNFQTTERYTEIERENRILLEKMTNILQKQRGQYVYTAGVGQTANKTSYFNAYES